MTAYTINFNPVIQFTDEQFYQLCRANPDVKFERNSKGEIIIVAPTGGETGRRATGLVDRSSVSSGRNLPSWTGS